MGLLHHTGWDHGLRRTVASSQAPATRHCLLRESRLSNEITKAFLLAAGLGMRLRPLTDTVPKCLVPIDGRPLLCIWLDICEQLGIQDALINTHHLPHAVRAWADQQKTRVRIKLYHEESLLGSAGTVAANRDFVGVDEDFYVFYADNLVHADLEALKGFHLRHSGVLTIGLFHAPKPESCGIATLDASGRILSFEEKPSRPASDLANAGIYVARRELFDCLPRQGFADFGRDVIPRLIGKVWGWPLDGYLIDVGSPESYRKALEEWPAIRRQPYPAAGDSVRSAWPAKVEVK